MKNPKVSVIIPVYNSEKTIKDCLNSVSNQTYKNYEIIVVDNNSTDKTKLIIKEFQKNDKRIKYVFEKNIGRGSARNAGIKHSRGAIIAMTDSDCIVPKSWLQELTMPIINENEYAVMGFEKDLIKNYWTKNIQKSDLNFYHRNLNGDYIAHVDTKNFAIKSQIIKKLMFDPNLKALEDFDFYLRLKRIIKIRFKPSIAIWHYHQFSFKRLVKTNFERGYYLKKIFEKHKKNMDLRDETMLESISIKNFLLFSPWMFFQFIKRPIREAYFILVSELSWRAGIFWGIVKT